MAWPTSWTSLFGVERPIIVEIGFGRGTFLMHLAKTFPDHSLIGLEISNRCLVAAEETIERRGYEHVQVIHSRAETAMNHLFEPETIQQVYINFPDPWFKKGHSHRRLMQADTVELIANRMLPDGDLFLATDIIDYATMSHELLSASPYFTNQLSTGWASQMDGRIVTKYEAKARREGRECYYFHYRRNHTPTPPLPVKKELEMPHMVMTSPLTLTDFAERFESHHHHEGDIHIHYTTIFSSPYTLLFEVHISEPTIEQHTGLFLSKRKQEVQDGFAYTLQMSTLGHPRPTEGMHAAVSHLGNWLLEQHPNSKRIIEKLRDLSEE